MQCSTYLQAAKAMLRATSKWSGLIILIGSVAGCQVYRFAYDNLDWYVINQIDQVIDLEPLQKQALDKEVDELLQWHRKQALPSYLQLLQQVELMTTPTLTDMNQLGDQIRFEYNATIERIIVQLLPIAGSLSAKQLDKSALAMQKSNEQYLERISLSAEEHRQQVDQRVTKFFVTWLGELSDQQQMLLRQRVASLKDTRLSHYLYRQERQQVWLSFLSWLIDDTEGVTERIAILRQDASSLPTSLAIRKPYNGLTETQAIAIKLASWQEFGTLERIDYRQALESILRINEGFYSVQAHQIKQLWDDRYYNLQQMYQLTVDMMSIGSQQQRQHLRQEIIGYQQVIENLLNG